MINKEELRIGNIVWCRGKQVKVKAIGGIGILQPTLYKYGELMPIEITKKIEEKYYSDFFDYEMDYIDYYSGYRVNIKGQDWLPINLFHLHQWQNLHYALTGEELIKKQ